MSVRPSAWNNSASTEQIFMKFYIRIFFKNLPQKIKFHCTLKINIHLRSYLAQFFLEREMFQIKLVKKIETHILWSIPLFRKSCRLWDNVDKYCRSRLATDDNKIRRMRIACWIPKATNTHSEYVTIIVFPLQQWLHESTSMLHYTYIVCLVINKYSKNRNWWRNFLRFGWGFWQYKSWHDAG